MINKIVDKHKAKLVLAIDAEVTNMFEQILNYTEVAVPNGDQYKRLRSRILRLGNDCKRNLSKRIEKEYEVTYIPPMEDFIEIGPISE